MTSPCSDRRALPALLACALLACGGDDAGHDDAAGDTAPNGRTFLAAAWAEAYDASSLRPWAASLTSLTLTREVQGAEVVERPVEAIVVPLDTIGIPWGAFSGPDNLPTELPAAWLAEVQAMVDLARQADKPVVLAISPLSPSFDTLAPEARDESGLLVLNSAWRPYCYDPSSDGNPTKYRDQFAGFARWAAERFAPRMIVVAQRLNLYEATCGRSAYDALVGFVTEAKARIAASTVLTTPPRVIASLDVEDLYGFPKKDGRCQIGTPADCLATREPLVTALEAAGVTIGFESYPARAFGDAADIPGDWLAKVLATTTQETAIVAAELPAVELRTERGVCAPFLASNEANQRAFLDQLLAAGDAHDMPLVAWRHLIDLQPAAVVASCPCAGDFALCSHLDGLGAARDDRRLRLVGGLAADAATERQAMAVWRALIDVP